MVRSSVRSVHRPSRAARHDSLLAFARGASPRPDGLALTGTDLYRDIHTTPEAQESLTLGASLRPRSRRAAAVELEPALRLQAACVYQSGALPRTPGVRAGASSGYRCLATCARRRILFRSAWRRAEDTGRDADPTWCKCGQALRQPDKMEARRAPAMARASSFNACHAALRRSSGSAGPAP